MYAWVVVRKKNLYVYIFQRWNNHCLTLWIDKKIEEAVEIIEKLNCLLLGKVQQNVGKVITYGTSPDLAAEP